MEKKKLSWALIVATFNRHDVLLQCVRYTLQQTCLPSEIIIIDASDNWQRTKKSIEKLLADFLTIKFIYESATIKSTTTQRNQGISLSNSDIVFLIDDDSIMYSDCAQNILDIYSSDVNSKIAGVAAEHTGILPQLFNKDDNLHIKDNPVALISSRKTGTPKWHSVVFRGVFYRFLRKKIFMMDIYEMLVTNELGYPDLEDMFIPPGLPPNSVTPCHLFPGYAMTFRRNVIKKVSFDPLLRGYAAAEDLDASHRASYEGSLLVAHTAKLKHLSVASGRINRFISSLFLVTNNAIFTHKHGINKKLAARKFYKWSFRRCLAELLKDILSLRWSFPQFRGSLWGMLIAHKILNMESEKLNNWYPEFLENEMRKFK